MKTLARTLLLVLTVGIASAQEGQNLSDTSLPNLYGWQVSGFGFFIWQNTPATGFNLEHLWLIGDKALADNLNLKIMAALAGPPKIAHTLSVQWEHPLPAIGYIKIGRFDPPFGWDFSYYRIDQVPTVRYASINGPLVARENGIEAMGTVGQSFEWRLAAMGGERLLGNIDQGSSNQWNLYLRPRYTLTDQLAFGASSRFGPVPAWGADAVANVDPLLLELEVVSSRGEQGYSALAAYRLSRVANARLIFRYENIHGKAEWTSGFSLPIPTLESELKCNAVIRDEQMTTLMQFVVRW